jgi:uncharacterized protein (DUF924 family)/Ca2+-binding EF-hand superfamily protein
MKQFLQNDLINFMFQRDDSGALDIARCLTLWFGKSDNTDLEIKLHFGAHVGAALQGKYNDWKKTPRGCLALMILVDQFPRNIYRHTIHSFDGNKIARSIVDETHDWLQELKAEECLFVPGLIMTHQENVEDQLWGVAFYSKLEPLLPPELHIFRTIFEEHFRIIKLCGAFPHRDHYYGRETSAIGRTLMQDPKTRFDLPLIVENGMIRFGNNPKKLWLSTQRAFDVLERIETLVDGTERRGSEELMAWLSEEQVTEFRGTFRAFDKDGDGLFDQNELATVVAATGRIYNQKQLQKAMDRISRTEGSSCATFEQFLTLFRADTHLSLESPARRRFNFFDRGGSGYLSLEDLKICIQSIDTLVTHAEIEEVLRFCDADKNGLVSFEEFLATMPFGRGST